jgi:hypothetical protein
MSGVAPGEAGGCLSREQVSLLQSATPGQAPPEIAQHLAACARCQERVLLGWDRAPSRRPAATPSLERLLLVVGVVLVAIAMFFYSVLKLAGMAP